MERISLDAQLSGSEVDRGDARKRNVDYILFNASFLISMFHLSAEISHVDTRAFKKAFLHVNHCQIGVSERK